MRKMDFTSSKPQRHPMHDFRLSERKYARENGADKLKTPQTERFQYSMAKTNEIELAVEKKSRMVSACKKEEEEDGKNVRLNELSFGGKYVYGRSGSKWDRGENFKDLAELNLFQGEQGRIWDLLIVRKKKSNS